VTGYLLTRALACSNRSGSPVLLIDREKPLEIDVDLALRQCGFEPIGIAADFVPSSISQLLHLLVTGIRGRIRMNGDQRGPAPRAGMHVPRW